FRLCYENGLRNNPNLQGRVAVRFVIGHDGAVSNVANGGSDMPDSGVVSCVVRAYYGLSFPDPERSPVTVTVPVLFSPGGGSEPPPAPESKQAAAPTRAKTAEVDKEAVAVHVDVIPHVARRCGDGAFVSFEDRVTLWRERISRYPTNPDAIALEYQKAL